MNKRMFSRKTGMKPWKAKYFVSNYHFDWFLFFFRICKRISKTKRKFLSRWSYPIPDGLIRSVPALKFGTHECCYCCYVLVAGASKIAPFALTSSLTTHISRPPFSSWVVLQCILFSLVPRLHQQPRTTSTTTNKRNFRSYSQDLLDN